jgi:ubiquinone/menaquinone biosynthesis C-methylase UbiE
LKRETDRVSWLRHAAARILSRLRPSHRNDARSEPGLVEMGDRWLGYYARPIAKARRTGVMPAAVLDEQWSDGRLPAERVLPHVSKDAIVLEIACGVGRVSRFVAPHCGHLHCTDILEEGLLEARTAMKHYDNVSFHRTNGYDLREFEDGTFDCVYSFTSFFHFDFELVVHYFAEIERVLKPRGVGMIEFKKLTTADELAQLRTKIERHGGIERYEAMLDKWRYVTREMLDVVCRHNGLAVIDDDVTRFTFRRTRPLAM